MKDGNFRTAELDRRIGRFGIAALVAGLAGAAGAVAGLLIAGPARFFQAYLFSFLFVLSIALGLLAIAMLHYLVGGRWGMLIRRTLEAGSKTLWVMAIFFLPILAGMRWLYPWTDPQAVAASPLLQHKAPYLNIPFFILRTVIYFAVWIFFSSRLTRLSQRPEYELDPERRRVFQRFSAFGLIAYVLTMTFASTDWIMSLQPEWFSTAYGLVIISGQFLVGLAFAIAILPLLVSHRPLSWVSSPDLFRDLGALLLSAVVFWAYIAFFQLLIIWSGNLPREVTWYLYRSQGGWAWVSVFVIVAQFLLPFLVLISLRAKRSLRLIAALSLGVILAHLAYYYWEVAPVFSPGQLSFHWLDLAAPVALTGIWLAAFFLYFTRTPALRPHELEVETALDRDRRHSIA